MTLRKVTVARALHAQEDSREWGQRIWEYWGQPPDLEGRLHVSDRCLEAGPWSAYVLPQARC